MQEIVVSGFKHTDVSVLRKMAVKKDPLEFLKHLPGETPVKKNALNLLEIC